MSSIAALATRGHTVLCAMDSIPSPILPLVSQIVIVADGYSVFASNADNVEPYFCSPDMGYKRRADVHVIDFVMDVANGVERSVHSRIAEPAFILHQKFESSAFNTSQAATLRTKSENPPLRGLPATSYFDAKYQRLVSLFDSTKMSKNLSVGMDTLSLWLYRVYLVIERSIYVKARDTQLLLRGIVSSTFLSCIVGYLQYQCANYGYYSMTFVGFPYVGTANTTAVIFFISAFTIAQQALNVHLTCQSLQMFRYEQFSGVCPALGYFVGFLVTEIPVVCMNITIFGTIIFFMTQMSFGVDNYLYFIETLVLNALIGVFVTNLLAVVIKKEIPVRDCYLLLVFGMVILSGFPFQLPFIRSYMNDISQINPMRWTFEAIMNWKFMQYEDGEYYLIPFDFDTFHHMEIFQIQLTFLVQGGACIFALLLPWPYILQRRSRTSASGMGARSSRDPSKERALSLDSDFGVESQDVVRNTLIPDFSSKGRGAGDVGGTGAGSGAGAGSTHRDSYIASVTNRESNSSSSHNMNRRLGDVPQRVSESGRVSDTSDSRGSLQRPHLFNRETSITGKSQLSINISQSSIHNSLTAFNSFTASGAAGGGSITADESGHGSPNNKEALLRSSRGPTVEFKRVNYSVKDAFAPMGVKKVLQNVSSVVVCHMEPCVVTVILLIWCLLLVRCAAGNWSIRLGQAKHDPGGVALGSELAATHPGGRRGAELGGDG
jgi:hypothetical protein